jgi:hypothetical protein
LRHRLFACIAVAFALTACGEDPPPRDLPATDTSSTRTLTAPPWAQAGATTAEPANSGAPDAGDGGASDGGDASIEALAGSWEGAYDAKKGRVSLPSGVKDAARESEDGKVAAGPGLVKITISASGDVTGKSQGALGVATVRGKIDNKTLRASFVPDDPLAPQAMTGVLIGIVKGEVIQVELRVAGPDALLVRQANFDLKRK